MNKALVYMHFLHGYLFDGVTNQDTQCAETKYDKEYILFEGLNF